MHQLYNISSLFIPKNITKIEDVFITSQKPEYVSFLSELKYSKKCHLSIIDHKTKCDLSNMHYKCFWCRSEFQSVPIGCPVNFVPDQLNKTYFSEISKDTYTIKESIIPLRATNFLLHPTDKSFDNKYEHTKMSYYETDGVFCSFNCCKAYINENKHNHLYDKSDYLLLKLYKELFPEIEIPIIKPAPSWRCLKDYGGHLSISEFRNSFSNISYEYHGVIKNIQSSIGYLYEDHIKL